jgi:hypothetical protein
MKNNKLLSKRIFILESLLLFCLVLFTSCGKYKKINNEELNTILEQNKNSSLFMSFYAHMPEKIEEALTEREIKNGKLNVINRDGIKWTTYSLNYDNSKVADFYFFYFPTHVDLLSSDFGAEFSSGSHYLKLERILNIYKQKYNVAYSNSYIKYNSKMDSIVLKNNSKVVVITGYFSQSYNYNISKVEAISNIDLKHYTNGTFQEMLNALHQESLNLDKYKKYQIEEMNKQNNNTLKDLN